MQLLFDYPWYFIFFCLLAGGLYTFALYWMGRGKSSATLPRWARVALPMLRFLSVTIIAFLLLAPLVRRQVTDTEKPIVVFAKDVSESVKGKEIDLSKLDEMNDYEVIVDTFGGKSTDIAAALKSVGERYAGRNLGAVVLASDGIYNQGQNPATMAQSLGVPIYTVAQGDTTQRRDAAIAHIRYNHTAYLGNQFPLEVTLRAHLLRGEHATLTVTRGGQRVFAKEIHYADSPFAATENIMLTADKAGLQTYVVSVSPCQGEVSTVNNSRTIAVEVLDGHQKIAILAAAPHPDVSALRQAIERNPNYEVSVYIDKFEVEKLKDCGMIIWHNLPTTNPSTINSKLAAIGNIPTLYVIGSQTDVGRFNALHTGLEITAKARKTDEVMASHNDAFGLFSLDEDVCRRLEQMPPLVAPFGNYRPAANLQSLFMARIGNVASDRPLIAFCQQQGVRHAFVVGEGLWRWRLQGYQMNGNHSDFDQLVEKMVIYTSLQSGQERFRVTHEHIYSENEQVMLQGELYDDNFEPVNTPEAILSVGSKELPFNHSGSGYTINLGTLSPGQYSYTASTTFAGKGYKTSGVFVVEALNLEQLNTVADHGLLNTISETTGGKMLMPEQLSQLSQLLHERDDMKSVLYAHTRYTSLLGLVWLFVLIVLLLSVEWGVRKYYDL